MFSFFLKVFSFLIKTRGITKKSECTLQSAIEDLKHGEMLDPLGQAWQNGSALAAQTPDRVAVNKRCLCGSLLWTQPLGRLTKNLSLHLLFCKSGNLR